jgi:SAM-dependent methyltransferase
MTVEDTVARCVPDAARPIVLGYLSGGISLPISVLKLTLLLSEPEAIQSLSDSLVMELRANSSFHREACRRAEALRLFLGQHKAGLDRVAALLQLEKDHHRSGPTDPVAHAAALFDAWVRESEEASVALYSFGDASLLATLTTEVVELLESWNVLGLDRSILQIGCGAGRFEAALAPRVGAAYGIDISAEMIAAAKRRCAGLHNVFVQTSSGRDLALFKNSSFDLVYAIDSFPYLHAGGPELVATHFAEARRVLRPQATFIIINFSYRGSPESDRAEVQELARQNGFTILDEAIRPFRLWDGLAWRLKLQWAASIDRRCD